MCLYCGAEVPRITSEPQDVDVTSGKHCVLHMQGRGQPQTSDHLAEKQVSSLPQCTCLKESFQQDIKLFFLLLSFMFLKADADLFFMEHKRRNITVCLESSFHDEAVWKWQKTP